MRFDRLGCCVSVFLLACGSGQPPPSGDDAAVDVDGAADVDASTVMVCTPGPEPEGWSAPTDLGAIGSAPFIGGVQDVAVDVNEAGVAVVAFLVGTSVYVSEQHDGCWSQPTLVVDDCDGGGQNRILVAIAESGAVMVGFVRRVTVDQYVHEDTVWATHRTSSTAPFSTPVVLSERMPVGGDTVDGHLFGVAASGDVFAVAWQVDFGMANGPTAVVFADGAFGATQHLAGGAPNPAQGNATKVIGDGVGGFVFVWLQPVGDISGSQEQAQNSIFAQRFSGGVYQPLETLSPYLANDWGVESIRDLRRTESGVYDIVYWHEGEVERRTFDATLGSWSAPTALFTSLAASDPAGARLLPSGEAIAYGRPAGAMSGEAAVYRYDAPNTAWVPSSTFELGSTANYHAIAFLPGADGDVELAWYGLSLFRTTVHADLAVEPVAELVYQTSSDVVFDWNQAGKSVVATVRYSFSSTGGTTSRPTVLTHRP